ncbi:S-adenosyl-L-methionine-dependent methyltransferase [Wilcoxina mikolae CBS 423.85]|nr:S-adenosyl-L-methionine-dependent methyltransferase [Wilcoxina mikolae CBS 423.85]
MLDPLSSSSSSPIETDPMLVDDSCDGYETGDYDSSEVLSLSLSINEYVYENGRRYHAYFGVDKNLMPTDEMEQDRLDMYHEIVHLLMKERLHAAPLKDPKRILDIGTGTGIWAVEMADLHPTCQVIGTDLSPIQPTWLPPNCHFEVDDAEQEWTFPPNNFDFIYARNVAQGIQNWDKLMEQIYRCVVPGGYAELSEVGYELFSDDDTLSPDNPFKRHFDLAALAMEQIGRPPPTGELLRRRLEKAGFVDVMVKNIKEPLGPWPKDKRLKTIGAMCLLNGETGIEAFGLAPLTRVLGFGKEEAMEICREALAAMKTKGSHTYNYFHVAYGRKPL